MSETPFAARHIGPQPEDLRAMLEVIGLESLDQLIDETVPRAIRKKKPLRLPAGESESDYLNRLRGIAAKNKVFRSYIGQGYYGTITPPVIQRCVLENPSWYTPYTPYQAEISQGRLEALLNFQTMVRDLTGMEIANASLLDEATAAAEAMAMLYRLQERKARGVAKNVFFVSDKVYPQTIAVLRGRAEPLGIELRIGAFRSATLDAAVFGALLQYPDAEGNISDLNTFIQHAHSNEVLVAVASDLLALTLLTPPGEMGADVVLGNAQRFGVPMGFGGPHAAFFATRSEFIREMPGRIIGISVDTSGKRAYRMALQTREQHIRREKAKSNICTAQALLANISGLYAVYHGADGLRASARSVHDKTRILKLAATELGYINSSAYFFDTLKLAPPAGVSADQVRQEALRKKINFHYFTDGSVGISLDETVTNKDLYDIVAVLAAASDATAPDISAISLSDELEYHEGLVRSTPFLQNKVFQTHRSETAMLRYLKGLEQKDLGLDHAMIPLGSCTMKLNAAAEMMPITWNEFGALHPFVPADQARGYAQLFNELEKALAEITGMPAVSLQPNAGSQGEFSGLMVIRAYHRSRGEAHRNVVLIPASAHGTNPASAVMAGMEVVVVACDHAGYINVADLKAKAEQHSANLAALMITYPSTYGVYEDNIRELCALIHRHGGQVYLDGANLNAQVGLTSPGAVDADVCHMNLHKTFAIPHGGGGPGMGPIAVAKHLAPFLPGHPLVSVGGARAIPAVAAAPWGSASILLISYGYIRMLGAEGLTHATRMAILAANYIKARLEPYFPVYCVGSRGRVAHELIFDLRPLKESGVDETDVAKRLLDFGFHAPTVSWPVPGTIMVEPTESEPKAELDRFCDAMIAIHGEIRAVIEGALDRKDNPLKNAPHTMGAVSADEWSHGYSRSQAAYPVPSLRVRKFWPGVARVDNSFGDKNLFCAWPAGE